MSDDYTKREQTRSSMLQMIYANKGRSSELRELVLKYLKQYDYIAVNNKWQLHVKKNPIIMQLLKRKKIKQIRQSQGNGSKGQSYIVLT